MTYQAHLRGLQIRVERSNHNCLTIFSVTACCHAPRVSLTPAVHLSNPVTLVCRPS